MKKLIYLATMLLISVIGVSQEKMEVEGAIIIKNAEDPTPEPGTIRFNPTTNDFEGWNGLYWASLTGFQYEIGEMMDQDSNIYQTVIIGTQEWMISNLRTTTYRNGNDIVFIENDVTGSAAWNMANYGAYTSYDTVGTGYPFDLERFGYLYNWYAVNDGRGLCPTDWHEPSDTEWITLSNFLGGFTEAGGPLKEASTIYWNSPNRGATNESGFTGLPGGRRRADGFLEIGIIGSLWSSTESSSSNAWFRFLYSNNDHLGRSILGKMSGLSVRCVKD